MPQKQTAQLYSANRHRSQQAFTLIEMIIVIALTGLLLSLILGPLVQGFNLTNRARAYAEAQDASRFGIEQLKREIGQASYVFDNSNTPIILPFSEKVNDDRAAKYLNVYSTAPGGNAQPSILFAKIDFIPTATAGEGAGTKIDPTTGKPLGGSPLVLPLAPGRRYVRYFIGLREPYKKDATGKYSGPNYYGNPFEFKDNDSKDNNFNSFVLWRAEYDPSDVNLIVPGAPNTINAGGMHDPNFFYNSTVAPNGRTFAENWRAVSSPVLATTNLDLIAWRKNQTKELVPGSPFQILVNFTPSSMAGETATPGFLSNAAGEQENAVPSMYTTQFAQWTFPYTITVYRASSQGGTASPNFGSIQFTIQQTPQPNGTTVLQVNMSAPVAGPTNDSIDPDSNTKYYWLYDETTGKVFIHTAKLTFQVDPARGRIETGFLPLATQQGVILYRNTNGNVVPMTEGVDGNYGRLVTTVFRQNTRAAYAGNLIPGAQAPNPTNIPVNAGLIKTTLDIPTYYEATAPLPSFQNPGTAYPSPFATFMGNAWQSVTLALGTERVLGPDAQLSADSANNVLLTNYVRLPVLATGLSKPATRSGSLFIRSVTPNYSLETLLTKVPVLSFDVDIINPTDGIPAAGLPAAPANTNPQGELQVIYLWQNNFARDAVGHPINTWGEDVSSSSAVGSAAGHAIKTGSDYRPEPDVMKVDYATRSQINILLGARVYDSSTGEPQTAQVTNRVNVGNVAR